MSFRVTPQLKTKIDRAAEIGGRSVSQEMELRLERSFDRAALAGEALTLAYGPHVAALAQVLARAIYYGGRGAADHFIGTPDADIDWLDSPYAFDEAVRAAVAVLEESRPQGQLTLPIGLDEDEEEAHPGVFFADGILDAIAGTPTTSTMKQWAETVRDDLGPIAQNIAKRRKGKK